LREILGVPEGAYRNWTELRRNTLDLAVPEVDQARTNGSAFWYA